MTLPTRLAVSCLAALACFGVALPQDTKEKNISDEDAKLGRIIERWIELNETERDHVLREVGRGNGKADEDDFDQWFTRLGGDDEGWDRTRIQRRNAGEIFDHIAERLKHGGPILSRAQFVSYAKENFRRDKSPRWRDPPPFATGAVADKLFKQIDRDKDSYLVQNEMSPALRAELKRWDTNKDGWIDQDEYRPYFAHRLDRVYREWQQRSERTLPPLDLSGAEEDRPNVARAGKLPAGLPAWFDQLDKDRDGQIELYEWRRAGWPLEEFEKLDLNSDGLITPTEILTCLALTDGDGQQPFAYLLQKRVVPAKKPTGK